MARPGPAASKMSKEVSLSFNSVSWAPTPENVVLHEICGIIEPGHVTAIMGESGSGKTTLLQILAGQKLPSSGEVTLNGGLINAAAKRYIGMVPQEDVILPTCTVEEAIFFSAEIRLPVNLPVEQKQFSQKDLTAVLFREQPTEDHKDRENYIGNLIDTLGLTKVRKCRVGEICCYPVSTDCDLIFIVSS